MARPHQICSDRQFISGRGGLRNPMAPARRLAVVVASLLLATAVVPIAAASVDSQGWTNLVPSPDSRIIYVSDSQGNDNNNGMSPQTPVKTIAKGYSLLRNGHPDWMLLKRGDTFTNQVIHTGWARSGRSFNEPMVVSSYGDSPNRPKILSPPTSIVLQASSGTINHVAFVGLHMEPNDRQPSQGPRAVRWLANTNNFLIEDCYIGGYRDNLMFQANNTLLQNIRIRRSVIVDAWSTSSHSQGIYAKDIQGLLLEENVFDHNGWHPSISGAQQTIYNHNMYLQYGNSTNVVVRGNVIARGSATGVQQRTGGTCEDNLLLRNPTNILFGQFQASWPSQAASGVVRNNVVFDAMDIGTQPRGFGIWFQNINGVEAYGNVVARQVTGTGNINGIFADYNYHNLTLRDNVVFDWKGGRAIHFGGAAGGSISVRDNVVQQPNNSVLVRHNTSFTPFTYSKNAYHSNHSSPFDPGGSFNGWVSASNETGASWAAIAPLHACASGAVTSIEQYMQCMGYPGSMTAFLSEARKQSRMDWRPEFTAEAVNAAVRAGYGMPPQGVQ